MADRAPYPDVEEALMAVLADLGDTDTVTPPDLLTSMPFIRILRAGGPDDLVTDSARVQIDAFGALRDDAYNLARDIRQRLGEYPHQTAAGLIDTVTVTSGPTELPWDDAGNVRRFVTSYTVNSRRITSAPDS